MTKTQCLDFTKKKEFGRFMMNGDDVPLFNLVTFLIFEDRQEVELYLVYQNTITHILEFGIHKAKIAITRPRGCILPDWYEV